jgi:RES domain-containing protein
MVPGSCRSRVEGIRPWPCFDFHGHILTAAAATRVRLVYVSTSLALAAIETFVNLEPDLRPDDLVSIEGEIPDAIGVGRLDSKTLRGDWHETRDESLRQIGDDWVRAGLGVALFVPSAAIRGEWNILLNPAHPEFNGIRFRNPEPFEFDVHMFR